MFHVALLLVCYNTRVSTVHPHAKRSLVARPHAVAGHEHTHVDERGFVVKCYHTCRGVLTSWQFWLGTFLAFPLEHAIWEKLWPFNLLTQWMGL